MYAIETVVAKSVKFLRKRGAEANYTATSGDTPLLFAVRRRRTDVVTTLLDMRARYHSMAGFGQTLPQAYPRSSTSRVRSHHLKQRPSLSPRHSSQGFNEVDSYTRHIRVSCSRPRLPGTVRSTPVSALLNSFGVLNFLYTLVPSSSCHYLWSRRGCQVSHRAPCSHTL